MVGNDTVCGFTPASDIESEETGKERREGKQIYYTLAGDHVRELVATGYEHILEEK